MLLQVASQNETYIFIVIILTVIEIWISSISCWRGFWGFMKCTSRGRETMITSLSSSFWGRQSIRKVWFLFSDLRWFYSSPNSSCPMWPTNTEVPSSIPQSLPLITANKRSRSTYITINKSNSVQQVQLT